MDLFDRLKADHHKQRELVNRLLAEPEGMLESRRQFDLLCDEIEAHDAAEEQTLYAELLARSRDDRLARHGIDAHDEAARLIAELSDVEADGEAWRAGLLQLSEFLKHHHEEQEAEAFALAASLISRDQAVRLGDSFARAKRNWAEVFGRVPFAEPQTPPAASHGRTTGIRRPIGLHMRGRPIGWFKWFARPLRSSGFSRVAANSPRTDSMPPRLSGMAGKALKRSGRR